MGDTPAHLIGAKLAGRDDVLAEHGHTPDPDPELEDRFSNCDGDCYLCPSDHCRRNPAPPVERPRPGNGEILAINVLLKSDWGLYAIQDIIDRAFTEGSERKVRPEDLTRRPHAAKELNRLQELALEQKRPERPA